MRTAPRDKLPVLVVVYLDDFLVVGSGQAADSARTEIRKELVFGEKEDYEFDGYVGFE